MVTRLLFVVSGLFTVGVCPGTAQSTLSGPTLGLFFDPQAGAIRPIWGIPGSATAGQPIDLGFPLAAGLISPSQDYALVISDAGATAARRPRPRRSSSMSIVTFTPNGPSVQPIPGVPRAPDRMVMSPAGKSAALYYGRSASAEILTNLPDSPQILHVDLSMLPNTPEVIAISEDGSLLLAGVRENAEGSPAQSEVFVCTPNAAVPRSIATLQHVSAIAFVGQSHSALLADDVSNSVAFLSDVANGASVAWTFESHQFLAPDSVQASPDGQSFLAGSSSHNMVAILGQGGSNTVVIACGCAPAELRPLSAPSTYQITEPANGLLWAVDGQLTDPKLFFVPIPRGSNQTSATPGGSRP